MANETKEATARVVDVIGKMIYRKAQLKDAIDAAPEHYSNERWKAQVEILDEFIGRLEAARKREREASGNTAALHEALKPVKRYLDGYTVNILELRRTVDAALTAPARNCDRFASAEEAWDAYDEWAESYRAQGKTEPFNEFGWLFALATEQEGEPTHA